MDWLWTAYLLPFLSANPTFAAIVAVMGIARLTMKPLFALLHTYVDATPTLADNEWLQKLENDKKVKALLWAIDWFGSIKILPIKK